MICNTYSSDGPRQATAGSASARGEARSHATASAKL